MGQEKIASQAYLEVAAAHGVEYVFGLPGTSGQEFIGTIADQEKIRFILALHGVRRRALDPRHPPPSFSCGRTRDHKRHEPLNGLQRIDPKRQKRASR